MSIQIKSKERVADHGEVFTADREVKAMCDLVKQETERIDSRFLEPACGDGNFLSEILSRKLVIVKCKYKKSSYDYERNSLLALSSIYGVDILLDNAIACRERLFTIWDKEYKKVCKKECNDDTREAAKFILSRNIVCGNALSLRCVDDKGKDTDEPIVFSEWTFPFNDSKMQRKDYTFDELINRDDKSIKKRKS
jgi:lantibiotic modifying enzyme